MKLEVIIGSGSDSYCSNCKQTELNVKKVLEKNYRDAEITWQHINITTPESRQKFGTLLSPVLIINDYIIHEGSIPSESIIERAIKQLLAQK